MALEGKSAESGAAAKSVRSTAPQAAGRPPAGGSPAWVAPTYLGGLVLLYLGERVIVTEDKLRTVISVLGVALVLVGTIVRFLPQYRGTGDRASIERLLGGLSVVGLLGVLAYFASTSAGASIARSASCRTSCRSPKRRRRRPPGRSKDRAPGGRISCSSAGS